MFSSPVPTDARRALFPRFAFYFLCLLLSFLASSFSAAAQTLGPLVEHCVPARGSANSVLELEGYRLGAEDTGKVKVYFTRGGARLVARTGGTGYVTNDVRGGAQSVEVIVPEKITPGQWQLFVEIAGQRSAPVAVEITEWTPPQTQRLQPARTYHGDLVLIHGTNFHIDDEIEITDSLGQVRRFGSGGSSDHTGFSVPADMPEGEATVRVGLARGGADSFSQPLKFLVTSGPLPLELWTGSMDQVAPGQWVDLVVTSNKPSEHSERTEVEFRQGNQLVVAETQQPSVLRVRVPATLLPGAVELRTRTWRDGLASEWSEAGSYQLLDAPAPPRVEVIEVGAEHKQVFLWQGPDRPTGFDALAGDALVLRGRFHVEDVGELRVTLQGPGGQFSLTPAQVGSDVSVQLPRGIRPGEWRLIISDTNTGKHSQVPIPMRVK